MIYALILQSREDWRYAQHIRVLIAYSNLGQDWHLQWIQSERTIQCAHTRERLALAWASTKHWCSNDEQIM